MLVVTARPGDSLELTARATGPVVTYFAALRRYEGSEPVLERIWKSETLEAEGGYAVVARADGYEILIFPQISEGGVLEVTLAVSGRSETQTLTKTEIVGWKVLVFSDRA